MMKKIENVFVFEFLLQVIKGNLIYVQTLSQVTSNKSS